MAARDAFFVGNPLIVREGDLSLTRSRDPARAPGQTNAAPLGAAASQSSLKQVLLHPFQVALVIALAAFALLTRNLWLIPLLVIGEIMLGTIASCSQTVHQLVGQRPSATCAVLPAEQRAALMAQMSDIHRYELERLEMQVDNIRQNCSAQDELLLGEVCDLNLLLRGYIDLATTYQAHAAALAVSDRAVLVRELRSLEESHGQDASDRLKHLIERRRDIVLRRLACWDQNRQAMREIEHQLATIANLIGLIHEKSIVQSRAAWVGEEIERIADDLERHEVALLEVSA